MPEKILFVGSLWR